MTLARFPACGSWLDDQTGGGRLDPGLLIRLEPPVAEGVEDADTLEALRSLGVDMAQGYHLARPAPVK